MASYLWKAFSGGGGASSSSGSRKNPSDDINWNPYAPPVPQPDPNLSPSSRPSAEKLVSSKGISKRGQIPTRVWVVKYLKDSIQGLVSQEAATGGTHSQMPTPVRGGAAINLRELSGPAAAAAAAGGGERGAGAPAPAPPAQRPLDERDHHVRNVLLAVEQCCFHGLRTEDFQGMLPFWALVEHVARTPGGAGLRAAAAVLAQHPGLNTPVSKARGFLRVALAGRAAEAHLGALRAHPRLLRHFYRPEALMLCGEGSAILLSLLQGLEAFRFAFDLDARPLQEETPEWPLLEDLTRELQGLAPPPPPPRRRLSWTEDDVPAFESVVLNAEVKLAMLRTDPDELAERQLSRLSWELMGRGARRRQAGGGGGSGAAAAAVLGVGLLELVTDVKRCRQARLDPALGVPRAAAAVLGALEAVVGPDGGGGPPDLFARDADPAELGAALRALETAQAIPRGPPSPSPHTLAAALLLFLHKLPEPLLTYERYDAFLDCQHIEEQHARRRNVRLLVEDLPWWHKPLLARLGRFLHVCARRPAAAAAGSSSAGVPPPHGRKSCEEEELTNAPSTDATTPPPRSATALAQAFAPALLRSYEPIAVASGPERRARARAAGAGAEVVRTLVRDHDYVLRGVNRGLRGRQRALEAKVGRLRDLHEARRTPVDPRRPDHLACLRSLWTKLAGAEALMLGTAGAAAGAAADAAVQQMEKEINATRDDADNNCHSRKKKEGDGDEQTKNDLKESGPHGTNKKANHSNFNDSEGVIEPGGGSLGVAPGGARAGEAPCSSPLLPHHSPARPRRRSWTTGTGDDLAAGLPPPIAALRDPSGSVDLADTGLEAIAAHLALAEGTPSAAGDGAAAAAAAGAAAAAAAAGAAGAGGSLAAAAVDDWGWKVEALEAAVAARSGTAEEEDFSLGHMRWARCGVSPGSDFGVGRRGGGGGARGGGLLHLACLDYLLGRFPVKAARIIASYSMDGAEKFVFMSAHLNELLASILMISDEYEKVPVAAISKQPFWPLLDHENTYQELFCMLVLIMQSVRSLHITPDMEDSLQRSRNILEGVLKTQPLSTDDMWQTWMDLAVASEKAPYYHHDYAHHGAKEVQRLRAQSYSERPSLGGSISGSNHSSNNEGAAAAAALAAAAAGEEAGLTSPSAAAAGEGAAGAGERRVWKALGGGMRTELSARSRALGDAPAAVLALERLLPPGHQGRAWELVYSLAAHGANLFTMLQLADGVAPTLLVVKDHTGAVFGGFAEGAWRRGGDRYYGEAGTFVFRLLPGGAGAQGFHWRGKNRYFMLCNQEGLALGGGGHFALFLDPDFYHGSSGACTTFESPPLCGEEAGSPSPPSHPPRPPVPPGAAAPPGSAAAGGGGDSRAFTCQEVELWAVRPATAPPLASRIRDRAHSFGN